MEPENDPAFEEQPPEEVLANAFAIPAYEESVPPAERAHNPPQPVFMWADIFFALLSEPEKTFAVLAQSPDYEPDGSALFGAALLVALANMISIIADAALDGAPPTVFALISGLCAAFIFWFVLALLLKFLCAWERGNTSFKTCAVVTGWAFLPLIFKAPFMCMSASMSFLGFLAIIPAYWFVLLQLRAYDSVLKLGKLRMLALAFVLPPLVVIAYLFWLTVSATLVIAALASMFPNSFS